MWNIEGLKMYLSNNKLSMNSPKKCMPSNVCTTKSSFNLLSYKIYVYIYHVLKIEGKVGDILEPDHMYSHEPIICLSSQLHIHHCHINCLNLAMVWVFTPQKLANSFKSVSENINVVEYLPAQHWWYFTTKLTAL